jgi:hypothetical protein
MTGSLRTSPGNGRLPCRRHVDGRTFMEKRVPVGATRLKSSLDRLSRCPCSAGTNRGHLLMTCGSKTAVRSECIWCHPATPQGCEGLGGRVEHRALVSTFSRPPACASVRVLSHTRSRHRRTCLDPTWPPALATGGMIGSATKFYEPTEGDLTDANGCHRKYLVFSAGSAEAMLCQAEGATGFTVLA